MKRSSQVALLLMGVTGVCATGYAFTKPPPNCTPQGSPAATAAAAAPGSRAAEPCPPQRSWSSSSYGGRSSWTRTNSSANSSVWPRPVFSRTATSTASSTSVPLTSRSSTSTTTSRSAPATTSRSGFGSTASAHSSGG